MVVPPDVVANVVFAIVGHAIKAAKVFFTARSSADVHAKEYENVKDSKEFWEGAIEEQLRIRNKDDSVSKGLARALEELNESFLQYEAAVKKWHRRVGSTFTTTTDGQPEEPKDLDDNSAVVENAKSTEEKTTKRRRIAPINRAKYVLTGNRELAQRAIRYDANEEKLGAKVAALSSSLGHVDVPKIPPAPGGVPALIRFIALAKKRAETKYPVRIIEGPDISKYEYNRIIIDPKTALSKMSELAVLRGDLCPKSGADELQSYQNCIIVKRSGGDHEESLNLARLFAEDPADKFSRGFISDPPNGAMLRCCAVFRKNSECDLFFRIPEGCSLQTLRQLLPTSSSTRRSVSKAERINFSIRLATSVLVVHSLGLVHKRIHPETIIVARKQLQGGGLRKLGFPYLAAFQGARSDIGFSLKRSEVDAYRRRGIYFHPRYQCEWEYRSDRYRMEDDIYSLGVCLFEIALWRSLLVFDDEADDYVYDDSFVALSDKNDWAGTTLEERASEKLDHLVNEARKRIPKILGDEFSDVVVACLTVGQESNPLAQAYDTFRDEAADDPVAWKYLELVLSKLSNVRNSYK